MSAISLLSFAQNISIIPQPAVLGIKKGMFTISASTYILAKEKQMENSVNFLNGYLKKYYGFSLKKDTKSRSRNVIILSYGKMENPTPGAYNIEMTLDNVEITAADEQGIFYGIQSLIQLLPTSNLQLQIPCCHIADFPRFAYRGMHLDVGRHFFSVDFIKKYIDYIALHKMNYFHWHLTEDQGWRIEIKKYPNLTKTGAWRNGTIIGRYPGKGNDSLRSGGYYTQEEIKEVISYAAKRYITVIPEIEMPGHCSAAIAGYPYLSCFPNESTKHPAKCAWNGDTTGKQVQQTWGVFEDVYCAGKDSVFKFLEDVLDEVMALFPSKYIHVGGDECPKENWKRCSLCQKRIKDEGLKDEHALQSYFIQRIEKYLNSKGRTLIGWDEILEGGLAPNAVVMSWRGEEGGIAAAKQKHNVIMTPGGWVYFDHSQTQNEDSVNIGGYLPLEKVYSYEPVTTSLNTEEGKYILGAQGNVWTEYMSNPAKVEYMVFPRISALSEVLWSGKEKKDWNDFEKRMETQFKRYDLWNINYSKAYFDLKATVLPTEDYNGVLWKLESKLRDSHILYMNEISPLLEYSKPIVIKKTHSYSAALYSQKNQKLSSFSQKFHFNKATGKKIILANAPSQNYPGDGAFTLVNGIINEKGLARSGEFLGFLGDCEAVIDLGNLQPISSIVINVLTQEGSWIYPPKNVEALVSEDGKNFYPGQQTNQFTEKENGKGTLTLSFKEMNKRFVKLIIKNYGTIPEGSPGAGNQAWLFLDEIEIN